MPRRMDSNGRGRCDNVVGHGHRGDGRQPSGRHGDTLGCGTHGAAIRCPVTVVTVAQVRHADHVASQHDQEHDDGKQFSTARFHGKPDLTQRHSRAYPNVSVVEPVGVESIIL